MKSFFILSAMVIAFSSLSHADPVRVHVENMFGNPAPDTKILIKCGGVNTPISGISDRGGNFATDIRSGSHCRATATGQQGVADPMNFVVPQGGCAIRLDLFVN